MTSPKVFGVEMKLAHQNGKMWCAKGVWLEQIIDNGWKWEVHVLAHYDAGYATRRCNAVKRIESAITRIRAAADKLGK